jgi:hypothetical protein
VCSKKEGGGEKNGGRDERKGKCKKLSVHVLSNQRGHHVINMTSSRREEKGGGGRPEI